MLTLALLAISAGQPAATPDLPSGIPYGVEVCTESEATRIRGQNIPVGTGGGNIKMACSVLIASPKRGIIFGANCTPVTPNTVTLSSMMKN